MNKEDALESLAAEIRVCRRCPLWEGTCRAVPGEGNPDAKIFFIGEAPGRQEDLTGRPFVGRSGGLLGTLLAGIGLCRDEVFIGNLVKHRPPGNRCPTTSEISACTPYLARQIGIVQPRVLVTLGRMPAQYLFSLVNRRVEKIGDLRGSVYPVEMYDQEMTLLPMFHPASALRNPLHKALMGEDFATLRRLLDKPER
jgi:uracil-DNA glycosylase family 4